MNDKVLEYVAAALQAGLRVTFDGWPSVIVEISRISREGQMVIRQQHVRSTVEVSTFGAKPSDLISITIKNWDEELRLEKLRRDPWALKRALDDPNVREALVRAMR